MSTKQEVLRLKALGHNKSEVARKLKIDRRTATKYWDSATPERADRSPDWVKEVDWDYVITRHKKGVFATYLFEEMKQQVPEISSYDSFNRYLKKELSKLPKEVQVRISRVAGKEVEVDYSGNSIKLLSPSTGELISTELFVGCLPYSDYIYGEFSFSQKSEDFISSHCNMLEHFGGVPLFVVPDNAKVAVNKYHRYDPEINKSFNDMADHYMMGVSPARPRRPKDKASVERAIGIIQQHFFPLVADKTFTSIGELNSDFKSWLSVFNKKKMKKSGKSRYELFIEEKAHLRSLPESRYELYYWKKAKVHPDCHFQFKYNYYSVPSKYIGEEIDLKFNHKQVSAYLLGEKIWTHRVLRGHGHYQTVDSHYPERELAAKNFSLAVAIRESKLVGKNMLLLTNKLIERGAHPLANLRKIQGILSLSKRYEREAFEYACEQALLMNRPYYQYINSCAKNFNPDCLKKDDMTPERSVKFTCLQGGYGHE